MRKNIKSVLVLTIICLVVSCTLAVINFFTADIIKNTEQKAAFEECYNLITDAQSFTNIDISSLNLDEMITNVYKEETGKGFVFRINSSGFEDGLIVMCAIDMDGKIINTKVIQSNETPGYGKELEDLTNETTKTFLDSYIGKDSSLSGVIDKYSNASRTSEGFRKAINAAFKAFNQMKAVEAKEGVANE